MWALTNQKHLTSAIKCAVWYCVFVAAVQPYYNLQNNHWINRVGQGQQDHMRCKGARHRMDTTYLIAWYHDTVQWFAVIKGSAIVGGQYGFPQVSWPAHGLCIVLLLVNAASPPITGLCTDNTRVSFVIYRKILTMHVRESSRTPHRFPMRFCMCGSNCFTCPPHHRSDAHEGGHSESITTLCSVRFIPLWLLHVKYWSIIWPDKNEDFSYLGSDRSTYMLRMQPLWIFFI